jgi:uncharacterized membrane protein
MNSKVKGIAGQVLGAAHIFILFLLLAESHLEVPLWLQAVGRMHPLLLHFPIVLLLLAMVMEFFRFQSTSASNPFYQHFLSTLLLLGSLLAAFTVIMGLLLAREEGYAGTVLAWHKWTGLGTLWLSTLLYVARQSRWYRQPVARLGTVLTTGLLIAAGHYGATLTHGENFLVAPLLDTNDAAPVPLEQAVVFDHIIQPIFQQKCVSCHNPEKKKGGLLLTDEVSLRKGGKTGPLLVPGDPASTLLLQRILLPADEKKHMPPTGKVQLTAEEMALLSWWVKDRADFKKKVLDLPPTDSLRLVATRRLRPAESTSDVYAFAAADPATIQKLTTTYRSIAPLARESPALSVNLYGQQDYSTEKLEELRELRKQIVFLNLAKMPVKDADLKKISQFENLQKLNLNFTDITARGLGELSTLPRLKNLSLAGTRLRYEELQGALRGMKALQTLTVWDSGLSEADLRQLRKEFPGLAIEAGFKDEGTLPLRLNLPQLGNSAVIFGESMPLMLRHPVRGVEIRYTTDGTEPDSVRSAVFQEGTLLRQSTSVRARAYKAGWLGSEAATFDFYKSTFKPDSVRLLLPLNRVHQAEGEATFFDGKLGTFNANSPAWANNWAGVRNNDLALLAEFRQPVTIRSVGLRTMVEPETGIFPPAVVEVWGGTSEAQLKRLGTYKPKGPGKDSKPALTAYETTFTPQTVRYLKIIARPVPELPDWHGSKGRKALLLVDEVFIN